MADLPDWQITYNGTTKSASEWGVENLTFSFVSQGLDQCSFSLPTVAFDDARVFAYGAVIEISKVVGADATKWFRGEIIKPKVKGDPQSESQQYVVAGPWFILQEIVYQQGWKAYASNGTSRQEYTSHAVLNEGITTQAQILDVMNYVIAQLGAVLQVGDIALTALFPPVEEIVDMPAAEVILRQLRFHPEAVIWWDYTVNPPRVNIGKYENLTAVDLKVPPAVASNDAYVEGIELDSREDLRRPCVAIKYEVRTSIDGAERLDIVPDIYPGGKTGRERGALPATVRLSGGKLTSLKAEIVSQLLPDDLSDASAVDWWKQKFPESLGDPRVSGIEIIETGRVVVSADGTKRPVDNINGPVALPYELVAGQWAEWMNGEAQREEVTIKCRLLRYDKPPSEPGAILRASTDGQLFTRAITTTTLPSGLYSAGLHVDEFGDPLIIGLAKAIYDQLQPTFYTGTFKLVEEELTGRVRPGNVINIKGGRAEWEMMRAMVLQVDESAATGETLVTVGPPDHLTIQAIVELLKVNRVRQRNSIRGAQGSGALSVGADGSLGKQLANGDRAPGGEIYRYLTVVAGDRIAKFDPGTGIATFEGGGVRVQIDMVGGSMTMTDAAHAGRSISLALAACVGGNADRALSIQETNVCEKVNGVDVTKKMLVLRSPSY